MSNDLTQWIEELTKPRQELGNLPVCPYAKGINFDIINSNGDNIQPPLHDFELIIYILPDELSILELTTISKKYNELYPRLVFLPDHKDRKTFIQGIQTSNGRYNLILCQYRDALINARNKLKNTAYYSYWYEEYIKEIFET